jgi:hydrogenase maturation protein HypF
MGAAERHIAAPPAARSGRLLWVRGVVQGVGFRPMVWHLAHELGLAGSVRNDADGVHIAAWGAADALAALPDRLRAHCPPLARIDAIDIVPLPCDDPPPAGFTIAASAAGRAATEVVPDAATCPDCLAEVRDPGVRRWRHAFANCTHCGPRFSIVRGVPYDRASTAMAAFAMCPRCAAEYADPADRRFHAQPIACPDCGPVLWLERDGARLAGDPVAAAANLLRAGHILAVKGIGSFHLVVDATRPDAVAALRARKRRPHKPLALMARDLDVVRRYAAVGPDEAQALAGPAAPVVLLDATGPRSLPAAVAPDTGLLGFMLPMSPLHHLLLAGFDAPLVFTSGNASGEPPCVDNAEALDRLGGIADAFLLHDRPIVNRLDDSVLRRVGDGLQPLRRSRGYAPGALPLPDGFGDAPAVTALGADLKNTACLLGGGRAILSPHVGDLGGAMAAADAQRGLERLSALFAHRPQIVAVDRHPGYHATRHGRALAQQAGLPLAEVQHHHAHVAACMADHGHPPDGGPVLGLALDGLGLGDDGTFWGGELLCADYASHRRLASLRPAALPGGDAASRQPWRNLAAQLLALPDAAALLARHADLPALRQLRSRPLDTLSRMIAAGRHAPPASSTGRLLDATAAALGLHAEAQTFEGQAAMALEALAATGRDDGAYPFALAPVDGLLRVDPAPLWPALLADLQHGRAPADVARRVFAGLAAAWAEAIARVAGSAPFAAIALSGGVFQSALFSRMLADRLRHTGLPLWMHRRVPANDGGLALGQAVIAAARALQPDRSN